MRILGIDYGRKKTGIAATDPMKIIVNPLSTQPTDKLHAFLKSYLQEEQVEKVVIGYPTHADGSDTAIVRDIKDLANWFSKNFSSINVVFHDENFSSKYAKDIIVKSGLNKKKRRDKMLVDRLSAVLILQDYLGHI